MSAGKSKKRQRGTVSEYALASDQTAPIYPGSMRQVKGWSIPTSKESELFEKKDYTMGLDMTCRSAAGTDTDPAEELATPNGWGPYPLISGDATRGAWGLYNPFKGFVQGSGVHDRVGRQIHVCSIEVFMHMHVKIPADEGGCIQWMIFLDKQTSGTGPTMDVTTPNCPWIKAYADATNDRAKSKDPWNLNNAERFQILKNGKVEFQPVTEAGTNAKRCLTVHVTEETNTPMEFGGNTGNVTDMRTNGIFMALCFRNAIGNIQISDAGGIELLIRGYSRIRYIDP